VQLRFRVLPLLVLSLACASRPQADDGADETGDADETTGDADETGEDHCEVPIELPLTFAVDLGFPAPNDLWPEAQVVCPLASAELIGDRVVFELDCVDDPEHGDFTTTVSVAGTQVPSDIELGTDVTLNWHGQAELDYRERFSLQDAAGPLAGGIDNGTEPFDPFFGLGSRFLVGTDCAALDDPDSEITEAQGHVAFENGGGPEIRADVGETAVFERDGASYSFTPNLAWTASHGYSVLSLAYVRQ
jgi:hypothetical protein